MHLSSFDANHIARPREQELGGIEESVEEEGGIAEGQTTDDETGYHVMTDITDDDQMTTSG